MTIQERENIVRVCGKHFERSDVPTYIRNRDQVEEQEYYNECCIDYPLGGMAEPYDIEREKELTD